jgi:hypothetical protein
MLMKHVMLAAAAMTLVAFSALAAEQKSAADDAFGGTAAMVSDETLSAQRAKGDDGGSKGEDGGSKGGNGGPSCSLCTANGTSTLSGTAFQGASGVITVVQNTGNQVFLQTTTVVNVSVGR